MSSKFDKKDKFFVAYTGNGMPSQKFASREEAIEWAGMDMLKRPGSYIHILEATDLIEPTLPEMNITKIS